MDWRTRLEKIAQLIIVAGGTINSRKKIHKLVYLLQEHGVLFDQDFVYHHYGVYSHSLQGDLEMAQQFGLINESLDSSNISIYSSIISVELSFDERSVNLIAALSRKIPQYLEALSTIVFLHRKGYSQTEIKSKFSVLKPHLLNFFDDAFAQAKTEFSVK